MNTKHFIGNCGTGDIILACRHSLLIIGFVGDKSVFLVRMKTLDLATGIKKFPMSISFLVYLLTRIFLVKITKERSNRYLDCLTGKDRKFIQQSINIVVCQSLHVQNESLVKSIVVSLSI